MTTELVAHAKIRIRNASANVKRHVCCCCCADFFLLLFFDGGCILDGVYCRSVPQKTKTAAKMTDRKAVIKNADMSEDMQQDAVDCATQAIEKYNIEKVGGDFFLRGGFSLFFDCGCFYRI